MLVQKASGESVQQERKDPNEQMYENTRAVLLKVEMLLQDGAAGRTLGPYLCSLFVTLPQWPAYLGDL